MTDSKIKISTNAAKWTLTLVWCNRLLGLISTLVLVKYLTPYDFGVAMTSIMVQGLAQSFTEIGYRNYLIKNNLTDHSSISSAWTLSLLFKFCASVVIIVFALISRYVFEAYDVSNVLFFSSVLPMLNALINPGLLLEEMADNYKNISLIPIYTKLITVPITILLAVFYQNFWSVVVASLIGALSNVIISYLMNSFRPKFALIDISKQLSFAKSIFLYSILGFLRSRVENFSVLYLFGVKVNGAYSVMQEFAYLPLTEIATPLTRGFFTAAAALKNNIERVELLLKYANVGFLILLPCFFGSIVISDVFTFVVLGKDWASSAALIPIFCAIATQSYLVTLITNVLLINERFKYIYCFDFIYILLICVVTCFFNFDDVVVFAIGRCIVSCFVLFIAVYFFKKTTGINVLLKLGSLPSIIMSSIIMVFVVLSTKLSLRGAEPEGYGLINLFMLIIVGFLSFIIPLYILSRCAGKHNSHLKEINGFFNVALSYIVAAVGRK